MAQNINTKFAKPFEIKGYPSVSTLMPEMAEIPKEFDDWNNKWNSAASNWFFNGVKRENIIVNDGIDKDAAIKHLHAVLSSWSPKHEHKTAAVAFLMSLWIKEIKP